MVTRELGEMAGFQGNFKAPVMLSGHFDVVAPEPDETQFTPYEEGEYLWGRGWRVGWNGFRRGLHADSAVRCSKLRRHSVLNVEDRRNSWRASRFIEI